MSVDGISISNLTNVLSKDENESTCRRKTVSIQANAVDDTSHNTGTISVINVLIYRNFDSTNFWKVVKIFQVCYRKEDAGIFGGVYLASNAACCCMAVFVLTSVKICTLKSDTNSREFQYLILCIKFLRV